MRLNWVLVDKRAPDAVRIGDLVSADAGGLPVYRVLGAENGRIRLRDEQRQTDRIAPLSQFHWKACAD